MPPLEERVEYPYQNIRTRNFPWGDGDKVSPPYPSNIFMALLIRDIDHLVCA